jgi:hypothetical protein
MKTLAVFLLFASTLLTGCIVAEPGYRGDGRGERDNMRGERDRDHDGVPNRQDRRPDDSRRY